VRFPDGSALEADLERLLGRGGPEALKKPVRERCGELFRMKEPILAEVATATNAAPRQVATAWRLTNLHDPSRCFGGPPRAHHAGRVKLFVNRARPSSRERGRDMKRSTIRRTVITVVAAAILVAGGGLAFAQGFGLGGGGGPHRRIAELLQRLSLTDQQEDMVVDLRKDLRKQGKALRQETMAGVDSVLGELDKPKPDAAKIHQLVDQRFEAARKTVHSVVDRLLQLHGTFSADQRRVLSEQVKRFHDRARKWQED
jgi:Spy/CpxP family protein refolding chaperone